MPPYPNLISDSLLINETVALLRMFGGTASAVKIVDYVMNIRRPEPIIARQIVQDLIERDPRLRLVDDHVELVHNGFEARKLFETDFVVFDLETTGAKAPPCRVTEIGAFRVRRGEVTERFHTLVNPEIPIPPFITALTGIDDEMVKDAPVFSDIVGNFLSFVGDSILVAHNAGFDMRFLNHEIGLVYGEYRVANPCLCTVHLSRKLLPNITNHKLKTVADHYSISLINHHRASDDARATAEIFINLLEMLALSGVHDLASIKHLGRQRGAYA
ncbi:MAG TPA: exonuclease domain-containing protein [Pyrinomonadaceae bacterium]|jgi:DNA polymerase III subunit alpha, Gram-positive type|nr:exonuclease domain-containing protein [Pyrinomonadaceae bacterium]